MHHIKISVRNLVEFILRSGDLSVSSSGVKNTDAMQEGVKIHKKIQKQMGAGYRAEVALSEEFPIIHDNLALTITLEGRADGIFADEQGECIDEIKGIYANIHHMEEPVEVHRAQARCYAYMYLKKNSLPDMGVRMTYCHIPTQELRYFTERLAAAELEEWFLALLHKYAEWMVWQIRWMDTRNASIKALDFPFSYRPKQEELVKGVYRSILRKKRLYIQAPTGIGKTISTIFPAVKAMGEALTPKIFYLTAKTITRTVAEETFWLLEKKGMKLKAVTITAKEKICVLEKPSCNPSACERAKGHYDRVNDAVFDVLTSETSITRDLIMQYAQKHMVCPFEMSLDIATWCDAVIGDYNYAFDPNASLKRFFAGDTTEEYVFLIDEAHNLVDRARSMYSSMMIKEDFLAVKQITKAKSKKLTNALENCNRALLSLKRECDTLRKYSMVEIEAFVLRLLRFLTVCEEYLQDETQEMLSAAEREVLLDFYFQGKNFCNIYEITDEHYTIYGDYDKKGHFCLHLQCMDPSTNLDVYLKKGRSSIFFSATFLPINYYKEQLASREDDYAIYVPSPFPKKNRLLMIGRNVSTKYSMRSPKMYETMGQYIIRFVQEKTGNYLVFFPSYKMIEEVRDMLLEKPFIYDGEQNVPMLSSTDIALYSQKNSMAEQEREQFLANFQEECGHTVVGLCVMGGIFGEGIDLTGNRLIGAVIAGTGLPMVCTENELFREYFEQENQTGFSYAYQYPGMNKVLQAAGRVIRTSEDVGAILLLDDRFLQMSYQRLFPREWFPYETVTQDSMGKLLKDFWEQWDEMLDI